MNIDYSETLNNLIIESSSLVEEIRPLIQADTPKMDLILPKLDIIESYKKFFLSNRLNIPSERIFYALELLFNFPKKIYKNKKILNPNIFELRKILLGDKYYKSPNISIHQLPMLFFIPQLKSSAFHNDPKIQEAKKLLGKAYPSIKTEVLNLQKGYRDYSQGDYTNIHKGNWKVFKFFDNFGNEIIENCKVCPITKKTLDCINDKAFGFIDHFHFFSVLEPKTIIHPHFGSSNHKLRIHLGIIGCEGAQITVGKETYEWKEGQAICFDDSYAHSVMHNGSNKRIILITDIYHPELSIDEINFLKKLHSIHVKSTLNLGEL